MVVTHMLGWGQDGCDSRDKCKWPRVLQEVGEGAEKNDYSPPF